MNFNIFENDNNVKIKILHDKLGNLFLENNDTTYYIYINGKNDVALEKINKKKLLNSENENYYNGKLKNISSSLKKKIDENLESKNNNNEYIDNESKYYEKTDILINNYYVNESDIDPVFVFYNDKDEYIIEKGFDGDSIYSFLIIDGGLESNNNIMLSEPFNDTESYKIVLYTQGFLKLHIIGSSERTYKLNLKNNVISFDQINFW